MRPFILLLVVSLLGCHPSNSQSQSTNSISTQDGDFKEVNQIINDFFKKYKTDGPRKAIDYIFNSSKIKADKGQLDNLKNKLDSASLLFGNFNSAKKITEKDVSGDLVLFSYLVKYDQRPIRFTFIFYKPKDNWMLYQFLSDDEVIPELEDAAKIFVIKSL